MAIGTPVNLLATDPAGVSDTANTAAIVGTITNASSANGILVAIATARTANAITTCTISDSNSLTWTTITSNFVTAVAGVAIAWALDTTGVASGTITATFDVAATRKGLSVHSITGLDTSTPVDAAVTANTSNTTGTPSITAAGASSQADTIFIAGFSHNTATADSATPSTGFTENADFSVGTSNFLDHYAEYKISSASETPTATMTPGVTTTKWNAAIVGLKTPSVAGSNWVVAGITMPP